MIVVHPFLMHVHSPHTKPKPRDQGGLNAGAPGGPALSVRIRVKNINLSNISS